MNSFGNWFKTTFVLAAAAGVLVLHAAPAAQAGGGGWCHSGPITNGYGSQVSFVNCFSPTILRVRTGTTVTWFNDSKTPHTVTGANGSWGSLLELQPSQQMTYTFASDGVYPYYCLLHPGMAGAVVVGDGQASGVSSDNVSLAGGAQRSQTVDAASTSGGGAIDHYWLFVPLSAAVALATAAGGFVLGSRRARS